MSINRSQAKAIADGFLDSLGSDKEDFQPKETLSTMLQLAAGLAEKAQRNLNRSNSVASGALSESIEVQEPIIEGNSIRIDVTMLLYGQYIDKGVKGIESGSGEFSFKSAYPSQSMVKEVAQWIKRGKLKSTNVKKPISRFETKNKTISQYASAYAVARSIKLHGIRKTGFMSKAISETNVIAKVELGRALVVDVSNSLPKNLKDL